MKYLRFDFPAIKLGTKGEGYQMKAIFKKHQYQSVKYKKVFFYLDVRNACVGGCVGTAARARSLSNFVADLVLLRGLLLNERFEKKKEASLDGLC